MIRLSVILLWAALAAAPAQAQGRAETLADLRAQLAQLAADIQGLRGEMVATGSTMQAAGGASALERMDGIEARLVQLTSKAEQLENRLNTVVADGTNRVGDLEFRLCELEEGCDVDNLPITATLGGEAAATPSVTAPAPSNPIAPPAPSAGGAELAMSEQADFDAAKAALDGGSYRSAADLFAAFAATYTGGPLTGEAHYLRGEALTQLGETAGAARAYLEAFSGQPDGPRAADALLKLGASLGKLGQVQEACVTLGEVGVRFPSSQAAVDAATAMQALTCQ